MKEKREEKIVIKTGGTIDNTDTYQSFDELPVNFIFNILAQGYYAEKCDHSG